MGGTTHLCVLDPDPLLFPAPNKKKSLDPDFPHNLNPHSKSEKGGSPWISIIFRITLWAVCIIKKIIADQEMALCKSAAMQLRNQYIMVTLTGTNFSEY